MRRRLPASLLRVLAGWLLFVFAPTTGESAEPAPGFTPGPMLARFLAGPMTGLDEIVFAVRVSGRDHWYVSFGNYSCDYGPPKDNGFIDLLPAIEPSHSGSRMY